MRRRALGIIRLALAKKKFDEEQQSAIIERGSVKVFGNRVQLTMAAHDVPAVGVMVIEAQT